MVIQIYRFTISIYGLFQQAFTLALGYGGTDNINGTMWILQ